MHACDPSCNLKELDWDTGSAELRSRTALPAGSELTRCYAGCLEESCAAFAQQPLVRRRAVLREKGFRFECRCTLCIEQERPQR